MKNADVSIPPEGSGLEEMRAFQNHLKKYQITVYQYKTKGVLFEGPKADRKINLIYDVGHYNVITNLEGAAGTKVRKRL